jgi:co-chaperonin GroES (HSP10)
VNGDIVPLEVTEGQTVFYTKGAGKKVTDGNDDFVILAEDEILAILK